MVITTHMYNEMIKETQNKSENVLENPDSEEIKSFLKNSDYLEKTEETVISSSS